MKESLLLYIAFTITFIAVRIEANFSAIRKLDENVVRMSVKEEIGGTVGKNLDGLPADITKPSVVKNANPDDRSLAEAAIRDDDPRATKKSFVDSFDERARLPSVKPDSERNQCRNCERKNGLHW